MKLCCYSIKFILLFIFTLTSSNIMSSDDYLPGNERFAANKFNYRETLDLKLREFQKKFRRDRYHTIGTDDKIHWGFRTVSYFPQFLIDSMSWMMTTSPLFSSFWRNPRKQVTNSRVLFYEEFYNQLKDDNEKSIEQFAFNKYGHEGKVIHQELQELGLEDLIVDPAVVTHFTDFKYYLINDKVDVKIGSVWDVRESFANKMGSIIVERAMYLSKEQYESVMKMGIECHSIRYNPDEKEKTFKHFGQSLDKQYENRYYFNRDKEEDTLISMTNFFPHGAIYTMMAIPEDERKDRSLYRFIIRLPRIDVLSSVYANPSQIQEGSSAISYTYKFPISYEFETLCSIKIDPDEIILATKEDEKQYTTPRSAKSICNGVRSGVLSMVHLLNFIKNTEKFKIVDEAIMRTELFKKNEDPFNYSRLRDFTRTETNEVFEVEPNITWKDLKNHIQKAPAAVNRFFVVQDNNVIGVIERDKLPAIIDLIAENPEGDGLNSLMTKIEKKDDFLSEYLGMEEAVDILEENDLSEMPVGYFHPSGPGPSSIEFRGVFRMDDAKSVFPRAFQDRVKIKLRRSKYLPKTSILSTGAISWLSKLLFIATMSAINE